jgi:hypothetical protein
MSKPSKPTCASCPYYDTSYANGDGSLCRRHAPRWIFGADRYMDGSDDVAMIKPTAFCGEHPDFPAWLAAQAKPDADTEPGLVSTVGALEIALAGRKTAEAERDACAADAEKWRTRDMLPVIDAVPRSELVKAEAEAKRLRERIDDARREAADALKCESDCAHDQADRYEADLKRVKKILVGLDPDRIAKPDPEAPDA